MKQRINLREYIYKNKVSMVVYFVLRMLVILSMVRALFRNNYESVFLCGLTLVLMIIPSVLAHKLKLELPSTLEVKVKRIFCNE